MFRPWVTKRRGFTPDGSRLPTGARRDRRNLLIFNVVTGGISMRLFQSLLLGSTALAVWAPSSNAHFRLIEPAQWIEQNDKGDPQKAAPCGGTSADPGKPTNSVVKVQGGE